MLTCRRTAAAGYWSSTSAADPTLAWVVDVFRGGVFDNGKSTLHRVRAVRGGL